MSDLSAADIAEGHRLNAALASAPWFPYVNDLIGGHCVMSVDKWPSETGPGGVVADFINAETAEAIAWMRNHLPALLDAAEKAARLETQLAAIKAADPDLFDPRGGYSRGAAYETYGSAGHHLREEYLAAIGLTPEEDADDE